MAFTFEISEGDEIAVKVLENRFETLGIVPIGRDPERSVFFSVQVSLMDIGPPDGSLSRMELMFDIVMEGDEAPDYIDDGRRTKFLTADQRRIVLVVICEVANRLLCHRAPDQVLMSTVDGTLPRKALVKYDAVSSAVVEAGYVGGRCDAFEGQQLWMFAKRPVTA